MPAVGRRGGEWISHFRATLLAHLRCYESPIFFVHVSLQLCYKLLSTETRTQASLSPQSITQWLAHSRVFIDDCFITLWVLKDGLRTRVSLNPLESSLVWFLSSPFTAEKPRHKWACFDHCWQCPADFPQFHLHSFYSAFHELEAFLIRVWDTHK